MAGACVRECGAHKGSTHTLHQNTYSSTLHHHTPLWGLPTTATRAGWGAPIDWAPATLVSRVDEATALHSVVLDVGIDAASAYTTPGQYIQVRVGGDDAKPGFFAIANSPGDELAKSGRLALLLKEGGAAADAVVAAPINATVSVSPVQGKGFPIDRIPPADVHTVLLFGTGSGVAPLRAAILSGALTPSKRRDVRFYYGTRDPASTAYASEADAWRAAGVRVIPVYSDGGDAYIQDVFAQEGGLAEGDKTAALLCGQKEMCEAVKGVLAEAGVREDNILLNF